MKNVYLLCLPLLTVLAACDRHDQASQPSKTAAPVADFADAPGGNQAGMADSLVLQAQVALDHAGFSPGVIDGREGQSYKLALAGFQDARGLPKTGNLDPATQQALFGGKPMIATRRVMIPVSFARQPLVPNLPHSTSAQAGFDHLGYRSLTEALAERFHTTPDALVALNGPGTRLAAGATVRVPAIPNAPLATIEGDERGWAQTLQSLGVAADQPKADHIEVSKSAGVLKVYDKQDKLIAQFPVTTGSSHDPLPLGSWTIRGESRNPDYQYDPDLFWDAKKTDKEKRLAPGPNGPVGVVWIDLSKDHYGIHGTPEPSKIGRSESHGCVRLTNWDAARLAQMVHAGTKVLFKA